MIMHARTWTLLLVTPISALAMPVLDIDANGELLGASGVDVEGVLYDVRFRDGTCIEIFDGCDAGEDFDFGDSASAGAAATALLEQVFVGAFDDDPSLTFGCEPFEPIGNACEVWTLFDAGGDRVGAAQGVNWGLGSDFVDTVRVDTYAREDIGPADFAELQVSVYADWSRTPAPVVEPNVVTLWGIGLVGLTAARLRRRGPPRRGGMQSPPQVNQAATRRSEISAYV